MESFSHRKGIKPPRDKLQVSSVDEDLRVGLWNTFKEVYWKEVGMFRIFNIPPYLYGTSIYFLHKRLLTDHFKIPLESEYISSLAGIHSKVKELFFQSKWNEVYDFVEFVARNYSDQSTCQEFMRACNRVLEREQSAYRFVGGKIAEIISEMEVSEIEEALQIPVSSVSMHLNRALELFSDRRSPDYRNSIKESISAVESLCRIITSNKNATLQAALKEIEGNASIELHPALSQGLRKLYAYTGDASGIRHALKDKPTVYSEDAKFMLVACSAFTNYLTEKASKAGIDLQ